jgi:uncharacterized repeat protein (TIGR02543 family)
VDNPGIGIFTYDACTVVELVASADSRYVFEKWIGHIGTVANVNSATTTITMNGDYTITANFALRP